MQSHGVKCVVKLKPNNKNEETGENDQLAASMTDDVFNEESEPTVGVQFSHFNINHGDNTIKLQIWDTVSNTID